MKKKSKKRAERSFSNSPLSTDLKKLKMATTATSKEHEGDEVLKQIVDSILSLGDRLENKIQQLHTDMDCFRHEIKENLDVLKATISDSEKCLEKAWEHVDDHTAQLKALKTSKTLNKGKSVS